MLALGACDGVESADADNLLDYVAGAIVSVRVCAEDTAQVRLKPQVVGGYALVAALVDAVALNGAGNEDLDAHVQPGEGIVAASRSAKAAAARVSRPVPVEPGNDLVLLVVGRVGEGVDVGGQAGRRGRVNARDVVVDAELDRLLAGAPGGSTGWAGATHLLGGRLDGLLDQVDEVGRAKLAQRLQRLGASLD